MVSIKVNSFNSAPPQECQQLCERYESVWRTEVVTWKLETVIALSRVLLSESLQLRCGLFWCYEKLERPPTSDHEKSKAWGNDCLLLLHVEMMTWWHGHGSDPGPGRNLEEAWTFFSFLYWCIKKKKKWRERSKCKPTTKTCRWGVRLTFLLKVQRVKLLAGIGNLEGTSVGPVGALIWKNKLWYIEKRKVAIAGCDKNRALVFL